MVAKKSRRRNPGEGRSVVTRPWTVYTQEEGIASPKGARQQEKIREEETQQEAPVKNRF